MSSSVSQGRIPAHSPPNHVVWRRWAGWLALIVIAYVIGESAEAVLPAAHLLAPLVAGLALAATGLTADQVPARLNRTCQAGLGVLIGSYLNPNTLEHASSAMLPLTVVTVATIGLSLLAAAVMARTGRIDRASATLGMVAGGSAAVISTAQDHDADSRTVAFLQCLRVALVAATAPLVVHWMISPQSTAPVTATPYTGGGWRVVTGDHQGIGLLLLAGVAFAGVLIGRAVRLPSPALLGPMLLTAAITAAGFLEEFAPTGLLRAFLFTIVGLDIGLRFTRPAMAHIRRLLPLALCCTVAISIACAGLAWLLSATVRIPLTDAYLATTPGGINAVLTTAVATHADVSLISSVQSVRLFIMVLLAPLVIRLFTPRPRPVGPGSG
ncbi:AbrB family transcriptional regulator [Planotetraspora silvatica]|uniref:AbrB family transcriptional regulator n=1 Tax=Planotetraspora silvatica TaxID=234614 RepID=A0A8J3UMT2_9ACTN|nr:AbrB family transcriptional regulator [Planotetraspora silvatica]GII47275.1 AbrB family transcriptional regulator [Planotetraspora silvatica]